MLSWRKIAISLIHLPGDEQTALTDGNTCLQQLTAEIEHPAKKGVPNQEQGMLQLADNRRETPYAFRIRHARSLNRRIAQHFQPSPLGASRSELDWVWGGNSTPARTLLSIAVQPGIGEATAPAGTLPFTATGTFDQPPTPQDNLNAQWASSDTTVATVDRTLDSQHA